MIGCGGVGLLLLAGMAGARPFPGRPVAGEAEPNAVFPGDGAGHSAALSYTDNGDGTATDNNTLLMWEVKDTDGGIHDVDTTYTWSSSGTAADGTLFTEFLATLNTDPCFAGYCDWRIPHVKELQSLVDYAVAFPGPVIESTFPGSTAASLYWASTEDAGFPTPAWGVSFVGGTVGGGVKTLAFRGRAVRGGQ